MFCKLNILLSLTILFVFNISMLPQQKNLSNKINSLKQNNVKVSDMGNNILKLEYPFGKNKFLNVGTYPANNSVTSVKNKFVVADTLSFDTTVINLSSIDTNLYYNKYQFWQEVPINNSDNSFIKAGDVNKNGKIELYGIRKSFTSDYEPTNIYEIDSTGIFQYKYQYPSDERIIYNIYDVDRDGNDEVQLLNVHLDTTLNLLENKYTFFNNNKVKSLAENLDFTFSPFLYQPQLNDMTFGSFDKDSSTYMVCSRSLDNEPVYIFKYNSLTNNMDSVYIYNIPESEASSTSGFPINDFDGDGNNEIIFSTI